MGKLVPSVRIALLAVVCVVAAACTQTTTGVSSYSGRLGDGTKLEKAREAKIKAARKRAAIKREKERKAFLAKRLENLEKNRTGAKSNKNKKKKTALRKKKKSTKSTRKAAVKSRSGSIKRKVRKRASKARVRRIKPIKAAFVGGKSRGIAKRAPWRCVPKRLKIVLNQVSRKFGRVVVNSTYRSHRKNRLIGGKRRSYHLRCQAVDFRVRGRNRGLTRWLARHPYVGGYKRYRSGYYHIDTGPRRTW